jgi:hypothetical protein
VLARFDGVRPSYDGWVARCPCPDHNQDGDQDPSLRITVGDEGRILLKCRVGCLTDSVLDAVGLDWVHLFAEGDAATVGLITDMPLISSRPERANIELCDEAYGLLLKQLPLADEHREDLRRRGLTDAEIEYRGYRSIRNVNRGSAARAVYDQIGERLIEVPGFVTGAFGMTIHGDATGLIIPVRDLQGRIQAIKIRGSGEPKYLYVTSDADGPSSGSPVHVPLGVTSPAELVRVTEGELKADVCVALDGTPTIGVPGVTQWKSALPVLHELGAKTVVLAFDADMHTKPNVLDQVEMFYQELTSSGFLVELEDWHV